MEETVWFSPRFSLFCLGQRTLNRCSMNISCDMCHRHTCITLLQPSGGARDHYHPISWMRRLLHKSKPGFKVTGRSKLGFQAGFFLTLEDKLLFIYLLFCLPGQHVGS